MPPRLLLTNAFLQRLDTVEAGSGSNVESVSYQQTVGRCFWKLQPVKFYAVRIQPASQTTRIEEP